MSRLRRMHFLHNDQIYFFLEDGSILDPLGDKYSLRMAPDDVYAASAEARLRMSIEILSRFTRG
jgi:hypothetical protein